VCCILFRLQIAAFFSLAGVYFYRLSSWFMISYFHPPTLWSSTCRKYVNNSLYCIRKTKKGQKFFCFFHSKVFRDHSHYLFPDMLMSVLFTHFLYLCFLYIYFSCGCLDIYVPSFPLAVFMAVYEKENFYFFIFTILCTVCRLSCRF
jgi:hypothetical protein